MQEPECYNFVTCDNSVTFGGWRGFRVAGRGGLRSGEAPRGRVPSGPGAGRRGGKAFLGGGHCGRGGNHGIHGGGDAVWDGGAGERVRTCERAGRSSVKARCYGLFRSVGASPMKDEFGPANEFGKIIGQGPMLRAFSWRRRFADEGRIRTCERTGRSSVKARCYGLRSVGASPMKNEFERANEPEDHRSRPDATGSVASALRR